MISSSVHHLEGPSSIFEEVSTVAESKEQQQDDDEDDDDDSFYLSTTSASPIIATTLTSPTPSSRLLPTTTCSEGDISIASNNSFPVVNNAKAEIIPNTAALLSLPASSTIPNPTTTSMLLQNLLPFSSYQHNHGFAPDSYGIATARTNAPSPPLTPNRTESTVAATTADHDHPLNINISSHNNSISPQTIPYSSLSTLNQISLQQEQEQEPTYYDQSRRNDPTPDSRRNRGGVTEPFPEKLHSMLTYAITASLTDIISFFPHGRAFGIHKPKRFSSEIMPRFFRQTRLTSFQRQLNLYGFRRIGQGLDVGGYYHELFLRGRPGLCVNMKRTKVKGLGGKVRRNLDEEPNFYAMPPIREATTIGADSEVNFASLNTMFHSPHNNGNNNDMVNLLLGTQQITTSSSTPGVKVIHPSQNSTKPFSIPSIRQQPQQQQQPMMRPSTFFCPHNKCSCGTLHRRTGEICTTLIPQ